MENQKQTSFNNIQPDQVRSIFSGIILDDAFKFTIDLEKSHGCYLYDSTNRREILDLFSFFATKAVGHNHPKMNRDEDFKKNVLIAAIENPTNSDFFTTQYANFIRTFSTHAMKNDFKHAFFIAGGTLAVENALKVAMDWKVKKNQKKGIQGKGFQVIHFKEAFHGRSGYTMSLTNSKPVQTDHFAQFIWPRINNPKLHFPLTRESLQKTHTQEEEAIAQIKQALAENRNDICSIIIEPIQSEGGDNHFSPEFLLQLRSIADENEIMLIFDEVQNGVGLTGKFWTFEHFNVKPDILAFGKKMQVCGIIANSRVDEIEENCFATKGRLNSTWGGSLADMVRATKILRIIEEDQLVANAANQGRYLLEGLQNLENENLVSNARGRGLQCAFDLPSPKVRDKLIENALVNRLLLGSCGHRSIRFRPALIVQKSHIDEGLEILRKTLKKLS